MKIPALPVRVRAHPVFFGAVALLVAAAIAGAWELAGGIRRWRSAAAEVARLRIELLTPQARPELIHAEDTSLRHALERLSAARAAWPGVETPPIEVDRLAVYAELVGFAEQWRAAARAEGVTLAPGEWFGFARHAQEAPTRAEAAELLAQKRVLARVLAALWAAGPERLIGVWREAPGSEGQGRGGPEWCRVEPARSVAVSELVSARAVRVAFVADTGGLRRFLNQLANEAGLIVREVAVAPAEERPGDGGRAAGPGCREMTVTLESVTVVNGGAGSADTLPSERTSPWRAPDGAPGTVVAELFAPPAAERAGATPRTGVATAVELRAVRATSYRWRLVGGVGRAATVAAVLEGVGTRSSVVLAAGEREPKSGVTLVSLEPLRDRHGGKLWRAILDDPEEAEPVVLTTGGGGEATRLTAVLDVRGRGEPLEVAEGARVRVGGEELTVASIRASPPEVELAGRSVLRLRAAAGP